jgi:hypothetical protein
MSNRNYIDNEELCKELFKYQDKLYDYHLSLGLIPKEMSDEQKYGLHLVSNRLAEMLWLMINKIATSNKYSKIGTFDEKEDFLSQVMLEMLKVLKSYNRDYYNSKGLKQNPFGYYTRCIQRCIIKQKMKLDETKSKHTEILLLMDDGSINIGDTEESEQVKKNTAKTREYVNSMEKDNTYFYKNKKNRLSNRQLKEDNITNLQAVLFGSNYSSHF